MPRMNNSDLLEYERLAAGRLDQQVILRLIQEIRYSHRDLEEQYTRLQNTENKRSTIYDAVYDALQTWVYQPERLNGALFQLAKLTHWEGF